MLLDKYLPEYQFNEIHSIEINAKTAKVIESVKKLEMGEINKIMSILYDIRSLPINFSKKKEQEFRKNIPLLDEMYKNNFFLLEENMNELVFGLIGKFWQLTDSDGVEIRSKEHFLNFENPKYGIVAFNMLFSEGKLSTETRILVKEKKSRQKFRLYWIAIRLGSGVIRKVWLKAIKRRAEKI